MSDNGAIRDGSENRRRRGFPSRPVALVTGGGGDLGLAIGRVLAEDHGARVCPVDLRLGDEARGLAEESGGRSFVPVDVRDGAEAARIVERLAGELGSVDFLVHCAGIARDAVFWKMSPEQFREVVDVHLLGAFHYARAAVPGMRSRGFGRIVALSSINGLRGKRGLANYSSAKAGMIGLVRTLAREVGRFGITANAVAPGMILTGMTRDLPPEVLARSRGETCLERLGEPEDVAWAVSYLCSPRARHVTGTVLTVDGGQTA